MERGARIRATVGQVITATGLLMGLYWAHRVGGYLLFHSLTEIFSVVVAFAIGMIVWNCRAYIQDGYLVRIGIAYLFVGVLDLVHTLAYEGMGVFPRHGANLATQLWIVARSMESLTFLWVVLFLKRPSFPYRTLMAYTCCTGVLLVLIFLGRLPVCYVEGQGLTVFKIGSEYAICGVLLLSLVLFYRRRHLLDPRVYRLLSCALLLTALSEWAFTVYVSPFGFANMLGHSLKLASFYAIYLALVREAVQRPMGVLFHRLERSKERLEKRVAERTHELRDSQRAMSYLTEQLLQTEEREKRRVANALHDSVAQVLAFTKREISALEGEVCPAAAERIAHLKEQMSLAIQQTRDITFDLSPPTLYTFGLEAALEELVEQIGPAASLSCRVQRGGPRVDLSDENKILLYRSVRELLINIVKHAKAQVVAIEVVYDRDKVMVEVVDDGRGFNTRTLRRTSRGTRRFGLFSIRQRLTHLGGEMTIASIPKQGTTVTLTLPLQIHEPLAEREIHEYTYSTG